jgi:cation:H+ antiporter
MVWLKFLLSSAIIILAGIQLAKNGDTIAIRTRLGGMFIGVLLIAAATSLPEVLTSISSINLNSPNLAAGNLLGSNMFNMFLLAIIDLIHRGKRILRKAALKHALSGSLAVFMIGLVLFLMMANIKIQIGWIGLDSIIIIAIYIIAVKLIQDTDSAPDHQEMSEISDHVPSLKMGVLGFLIAAAVLVLITPLLVESSNEIAEITGLGATFIGTTLVALVTSLPELVTTLAAVKIGADDMAIGNLFGSNMFNMFAFGLTDVFYSQGRFLDIIDPSFQLVASLGIIMTGLALIGNLAKLKRRIWFIEIDVFALILVYIFGVFLLYNRG